MEITVLDLHCSCQGRMAKSFLIVRDASSHPSEIGPTSTVVTVDNLDQIVKNLTKFDEILVDGSVLEDETSALALLEWFRKTETSLLSNEVIVKLLNPEFETKCDQDGIACLQTLIEVYSIGKQRHLFTGENWIGLDIFAKGAFLRELKSKEALEHAKRFRKVMNDSSAALENIAPVPQSLICELGFCSNEYFAADAAGKRILSEGKCAFVLVAGGLGERLGSTQIKLSLPTESLTGKSFLELFLAHLDTFLPQSPPPLCIMTSDDTHAGTIKLLDSLGQPFSVGQCSGISRITLCKQETVPCFSDKTGSIALKSPGKLLLKPHGHGDVHPLVHKACVERWHQQKIEYIVFFQDTNPNCFRVLPALIGMVATSNNGEPFDCAIACVPRVPGSATGCIASAQGGKTIENVEYNLMNAFLGKGPDKFTLGNTNQFVLRMNAYHHINPNMPEFCNPKYQPNSTSAFSSPARLECLMQDVLRFVPGSKVKPVLFRDSPWNKTKTHVLYAPAKNSLAVAQRAWDANTTDGSPAASEAAVYAGNCDLLISLGCTVEADEANPVKFGQSMQILPLYPCVVFDPHVLPFWSDARLMFPEPTKVFIGKNASVEFRGPGRIICRSLRVEGSLKVWAKTHETTIELKDVFVKNSGRKVAAVPNDARIHVTPSDELCVIECDRAGLDVVTLTDSK